MSDAFTEGATTSSTEPPAGATTPPTEPPAAPTSNAVDEWVGEGKKYGTVDDLASAYKSADQRLEELKLANERLVSEKVAIEEKAKGVDDVLAELRLQASTPHTTEPTAGMSPDDISKLVTDQLATQRSADTKAAKVKSTWGMMDEAFGGRDVASQAVQAYIGDDESKKAIVNSMAVSDPAGLMKLLGKDVEKKTTTFTTNHDGTANDKVNLENKLTWEVASHIRKTNPKLYYSHAFRARMQAEL